jgi:sugar O-acyltransferase (sialic acid O-acetyltransferase NeuD family)
MHAVHRKMRLKTATRKNLVILGAGGHAREVSWLVGEINQASCSTIWNVIGFVENTRERIGQHVNGIPIISLEKAAKYSTDIYAVAAIGKSETRERAVKEAEELGFRFATLIHPTVCMDRETVKIGQGSMICAGNILTVNINIGKHVLLNNNCTIGHDCVLEDYVSLAPGCHLSGYTILRRGCYLGTGSVTIEKIEIGHYSVIGAGAVVINNIPANVTAAGVPTRIISKQEEINV